MKFLFISYDAILLFASNRYFQSADFEQTSELCSILKNESDVWSHNPIFFKKETGKGGFFYTKKIEKNKGLLFDFTSFFGFNNQSDDKIITIFQKTIKYAIKYFEGLPLLPCEKRVNDSLVLVYPFPFMAIRDVDKVYIDTKSTGDKRHNQNILTVFYYGSNENVRPSFLCLDKAVDELRTSYFPIKKETEEKRVDSLYVTGLDESSHTITLDSHIGYDLWQSHLTKAQLKFVGRNIKGTERLEGAAGSGKTISLVLRCVYLLSVSTETPDEYHIIFVTHSIPTKDKILEIFCANCPNAELYLETSDKKPAKSILITTLQEWSGKSLGTNSIEDSEYLDKDAESSKIFQFFYIKEAFQKVVDSRWKGYSLLCSSQFVHFKEVAKEDTLIELLQYEISVLIKGRAGGELNRYLKLLRPKLSLPVSNENDLRFIYDVYSEYQKSLEQVGLFDSDDITLSALGQLDTPIRRRRNINEGYDVCFIDEAQLFNLNELSVFHLLNKPTLGSHIIYAIDKSQSFYEVGFSDDELHNLLRDDNNEKYKLNTIFRSSPEIVNLAFNVLSANSAIFSNFDNPLDMCSFSFTKEEENKCLPSEYRLFVSDSSMVQSAINTAETYSHEKKIPRSSILIAVTSEDLLKNIEEYAHAKYHSVVTLKSRNDTKAINAAINSHRFVIGNIDYVGGLEFDAVIIVGVDKGRVPPEDKVASQYQKYAWHNKMYVAITRAKYSVMIFGNKINGISSVMESAIACEIINCSEAE